MPLKSQLRILAFVLVMLGTLIANLTQKRFFPFVPYSMFTRKIDADRAAALIPLIEFTDGEKFVWILPEQLAPFRLGYQDPELWKWLENGDRNRVQERLQHWAENAERDSGRKVQSVRLLKVSNLVDQHGDLQIDVAGLESRGHLAIGWRAP